MVIPDFEHDTIAQKRVAQALTKITIFPQISQFGQISVEVLPLQLPTLVEFVPFICLIDISSKILVNFWMIVLTLFGSSESENSNTLKISSASSPIVQKKNRLLVAFVLQIESCNDGVVLP